MGYKHGQARRGKKTPEYCAWEGMKQRCQNPNDSQYKDYGGRGIRVCNRWQKFKNFYSDMGPKPGPDYSLDRSNNDGNYELDNCQWATWIEQENNKRPISCGPRKQRFFYGHGPRGEMIIWNNQSEVAREFGLNSRNISKCLNGVREQSQGWTFKWI